MVTDGSLRVYETAEELYQSVAQMMVDGIERSLRERPACTLALSGGETPRPVYRRLGSSPLREMVSWERVHILFGDERMGSQDDTQSNFGMVERELLSRVPIPPEHIHRIPGEKPPEVAAREYEKEVESLLSGGRERMDLVLLGLGEDGHTASLFPGSSALREGNPTIRAVFVRRLGGWRVTMTLPLINAARRIVFVVTGREKADILRRVLSQGRPTPLLPASLVRPGDGELIWAIDRAAGSALT